MAAGLSDYYGILGLKQEADEGSIKKAYRKLVLQWHPDKHKEDREEAEAKIREVNDAYETLSNPWKRRQYDEQIEALLRKARGIKLDTAGIVPRMGIPKEFMLQPIGYPEKFVRTIGMRDLFVHSRADDKMDFRDFFRDAQFSLYWLPEVNNMCRLRPTTTAGVGQDGGLNFNFFLHRTVQMSEVVLQPGSVPDNANVMAVASPVVKHAFRFESAAFPGHYLAFKPPKHLRMVGGIVDESFAIDFSLVDYAQMFQYITADEVFSPAVKRLGGEKDFVILDLVRADKDVAAYFKNVLKIRPWSDEDFETFFESRSSVWEYNAEKVKVRLRSRHEQLENSLRRSRNIAEVAASISAAADYDVCLLPVDTLEAMLDMLEQPPPGASVTLAVNILDAQKKVLVALPSSAEKRSVSFKRLLSMYDKVVKFGVGLQAADERVAKQRTNCAEELAELISDMIKQKKADDDVSKTVFAELCQMPLSWRRASERLARLADRVLDKEPLEALLPIINNVVKALPNSEPLAKCLAGLVRGTLRNADANLAAEALDTMVSGGLCLESVPRSLERILKSAPLTSVAAVVAGLGEKAVEGEDMRACAAFVGKAREGLENLSPEVLLRLAKAATKSAAVADKAMDGVASAAALSLPGWTTDSASSLLLAASKAKSNGSCQGFTTLYKRACEVLIPKLSEFTSVQIVKIVLAISQVLPCRPLLEAVAKDATANRLQDIPNTQLIYLTQGLFSLGKENASVIKLLDHWAKQLKETARIESLLTESIGVEMVAEKRKDLESKGQLNVNQLADLAQKVAKVTDHKDFWVAFAKRVVGEGESKSITDELNAAGKAALEAAFPEGGGPEFNGKVALLMEIKEHGSSTKKREKDKKEKKGKKDKKEKKNGKAASNSSSSSADASPKKKKAKTAAVEESSEANDEDEDEDEDDEGEEEEEEVGSGSSDSDADGETKGQSKEEKEAERLRLMQEKIAKRREENKEKQKEEERRKAEARERKTKAEEERSKRDAEVGAKRKLMRDRKKKREELKKARQEEAAKKKAAAVARRGPIQLDDGLQVTRKDSLAARRAKAAAAAGPIALE